MDELKLPLCGIDRLRMATDGHGVTALVVSCGCPLDCRYCINPFTRGDDAKFKTVTPEELFERVKKDDLYYRSTGGGITFGGGEPLLHAEFIEAFRRIAPEGWRFYTETSLYVPEENVRTAAGAIDRFYVDIKDTDREIYKKYTGIDGAEKVLDNLRLLKELAGSDRITVRVPLIPGYNNRDNVRASVELLKKMGLTEFDCFRYRVRKKAKNGAENGAEQAD